MKATPRRKFLVTTAGGTLGSLGLATAQDSNVTPVFWDGKTLTGWHKPPGKIGHGTGGRWEVHENGVLTGERALHSGIAVLAALAGMWLGKQLRQRIEERAFRRLIFLALTLLALNLIRRSAF